MNPADELVDLVDEDDRVTGQALRREVRAQHLRHRAVYILVFNDVGQLFVHKRTGHKDVYPSHYDVAAGGVLGAGEGYDEGAARELEEELGIRGVPLRRLFPLKFSDPDGARVNGMVYSCTFSGGLRLDANEIEHGDWMDLDAVVELAQRAPVCPDSFEALRLYFGYLESLADRRR